MGHETDTVYHFLEEIKGSVAIGGIKSNTFHERMLQYVIYSNLYPLRRNFCSPHYLYLEKSGHLSFAARGKRWFRLEVVTKTRIYIVALVEVTGQMNLTSLSRISLKGKGRKCVGWPFYTHHSKLHPPSKKEKKRSGLNNCSHFIVIVGSK